MNHWAWQAKIHQLAQLFSNTLPVFDRVSGELHTRFFIDGADLETNVPEAAVRPASLTVFDGEQFLHRQPMMYGKWRRNGLPGTAQLVDGLAELLAPTTRRDDAALCVLANLSIHQSASARYFTLHRIHADRLVGFSDQDVAELLKICRRRTALLRHRLVDLSQDATALTNHLSALA